jgi:GGDEF domain-containing protein
MGGDDVRLRAVVGLAQGMAAAHAPRESWRAAAAGACRALGGSFAALSVWERELGRLRVLANVGERARDEEEFPEDEAYPVHQFPEITEFLHERWVGGGGPNAWVETADGPAAGHAEYCHQRVAALRRRGRGCCVVAPIVMHGRAWGELYVARPAGAPVFDRADADFATVLASVVAAGIAQTERLEEARRLAFTDALTGLANRRAVDMRLDEAIERHRAEGVVVSLVVCDLNGLKRVNDTHGHAVGDRLLERFGSVLSLCGAMLPGTLAARLGGDEFCLLAVGPAADEVVRGGRRSSASGAGRAGVRQRASRVGSRPRGTRSGPVRLGPAALPARGRGPVPREGGTYGVSTGFGALATRHIPTELRAQLQRS